MAGNSLMSSRPFEASRMRFSASCARMLTGWVGSWPVASLYSNSAARTGRVKTVASGKARHRQAGYGGDVWLMGVSSGIGGNWAGWAGLWMCWLRLQLSLQESE